MVMESPKLLEEFLDISRRDPKAELECKLLSGRIPTKDVADRLIKAVQTLSSGPPVESNILRIGYPDNIRVEVNGAPNIQRVCASGSFKGVPLEVQRKTRYFETTSGKQDILEIPDYYTKFTMRHEDVVRKDWDGAPNAGFIRLLARRSYKTLDEMFQIDISMVKSEKGKKLSEVLKLQPLYELEIEFINKDTKVSATDISKAFFKIIRTLIQAYQQTEFTLKPSQIQLYQNNFRAVGIRFWNPVTMLRRHLRADRPANILKGYTVTVKADGQRTGLYVTRDRNVVLLADRGQRVIGTGITAIDDKHIDNFIDGEYIPEKNMFLIFDIYRYKGKDIRQLPLMKTDEDTLKNPANSRLGCAKLFVEDLGKDFRTEPSDNPLKIETKLFLAGDGATMEKAIQQMLDTEFEFETDGLIFTPRSSGVSPPADTIRGETWTKVYKWKPPHQNSIDFLIRFKEEVYDPVGRTLAKKAELYVQKEADDDIIYPCQTLTGEYVSKPLPADMRQDDVKVPALFQPSFPRDESAGYIYVPLNDKNVPVDRNGDRVEDNTNIECAYDLETNRWIVMRTRYDKTYAYRVEQKPVFGNKFSVAQNIWSSIHVPVNEEMIRNFVSKPIDDASEEDIYYKEDVVRRNRVLKDSYNFHNIVIKNDIYRKCVKEEDTLLEIAVGEAGDMPRWKITKPSKVVGIDYAIKNIEGGKKGACARYLQDKKSNPLDYRPPVLFVQGDMTQPLFEGDNLYYRILNGEESAPTKYLSQFEGLKKFDDVSCQFAIHYTCENEETFRVFAASLSKHCKGTFFGTCLDGPSVYSLLLGKPTHLFTDGKNVGGQFTKQYDDRENWNEEFGMKIKVLLESFEIPQDEFLVPFKKITEILEEYGFQLEFTQLFNEYYSKQTSFVLTKEQQEYSFLHRAFVFKKVEKKEEPKEEKTEEETPVEEGVEETPVVVMDEGKIQEKVTDEVIPEYLPATDSAPKYLDTTENKEVKVTEEKPKKRKLNKGGAPKELPILFLGAGEHQGPYNFLSNDAEYPIEIEGVRYPTVEHYYQAMKAKEFGDEEMISKIAETKTAKSAKALGKKVRNFIKEIWDDKRLEIMKRGVKAKFVQHPELQKKLLDTGNKIIGKADPRNTFWGIGTGFQSEKSGDPSKWRGQNRLGKLLMEFRDSFKESS